MVKPTKSHHEQKDAKKGIVSKNNKDEQEETFARKLCSRYIPRILLFLVLVFVILVIFGFYLQYLDRKELGGDDEPWFAWPSSDDDDDSAAAKKKKSSGDSISTTVYSVNSSCTTEDLAEKIHSVYGNFSRIMKSVEDITLNELIQNQYEIDQHNRKISDDAAKKNKKQKKTKKKQQKQKKAAQDESDSTTPDELPKDDEEESIPDSGELRDSDRRLGTFLFDLVAWTKNAKGFAVSVEKSCTETSFLAMITGSSNENSKKLAVADLVRSKMLPQLYKDLLKLLRFAFSAPPASSGDSEFTGKPDDASRFAEKLIATKPGFVSKSIAPLRDVLIRVMMILADVSFSLEREDYHAAFMYHLVRFNDNIVAKYIRDEKKSKKSLLAKNPNQAKIAHFNNVLPALSCASPQAAYMCTVEFGTHLVRAKGGASYDQDPQDTNSEHYSAYLFGLLRSAFVEELIALRNTNPVLRMAYGYSLLELQRYESAHSALQAAAKLLDDGDEGADLYRKQHGDVAKSGIAALGKLLSCFRNQDVVDYTNELRRGGGEDNLRIFEKWTHFLLDGEEGANKCAVVADSDSGTKAMLSVEELQSASSMMWPLKNQKVDGTIVDDNEESEREFVPLLLM